VIKTSGFFLRFFFGEPAEADQAFRSNLFVCEKKNKKDFHFNPSRGSVVQSKNRFSKSFTLKGKNVTCDTRIIVNSSAKFNQNQI
jgi:hypothetical protein